MHGNLIFFTLMNKLLICLYVVTFIIIIIKKLLLKQKPKKHKVRKSCVNTCKTCWALKRKLLHGHWAYKEWSISTLSASLWKYHVSFQRISPEQEDCGLCLTGWYMYVTLCNSSATVHLKPGWLAFFPSRQWLYSRDQWINCTWLAL